METKNETYFILTGNPDAVKDTTIVNKLKSSKVLCSSEPKKGEGKVNTVGNAILDKTEIIMRNLI